MIASASEKEGWGLTVLEAAACGTPAVVTDVPGLRDAVRGGETGLLVPLADAAAIGRLLEDQILCERLGAGALRWAARFTWKTVAADISKVLDAHGVRRAEMLGWFALGGRPGVARAAKFR